MLAVQVPLLIAPPSIPPQPAADGPTVRFRTDASAAEIVAAGARLLVPYGAFSLADGPSASLGRLAALGRYASALADANLLRFLSGDVDVHGVSAQGTTPWIPDAAGHAAGVVHFIGPILPSWEAALASQDVRVLAYVPVDGLLVSASPATLAGLRALPYVDWVGPYAPAWKVRPGLPTEGQPVEVDIVALPGEPPEAIEAWLGHQGVAASASAADGQGIVGVSGQGDFRWVRARVDPRLIPQVAALPWVEFVDAVNVPHVLNAEADWVIQTNLTNNYRYWSYGLNGAGQVIGVADTGVDYDNAQFRQSAGQIVQGDLYNVTDASRRKIVRYLDMGVLTGQLTWPGGGGQWDPASIQDCPWDGGDGGHGTAVVSTLAGNDNGIGSDLNDGNALGAQVYMQDVGGLSGGTTCALAHGESLLYLPSDYADLFAMPGLVYNDPAAPVRIHSDSWGADVNEYDVQARSIDAFLWTHPDLSVFFAVGNAGSGAGTVDTPATAKDVVSVGGTCNPDDTIYLCAQNDIPSFDSRGPTADGRYAPTILTVAEGDSASSDGSPWSNVASPGDHWWRGTSYATPAAAAAAAIVRQYFTGGWYPTAAPVAGNAFDPSAALIRAMLIASGAQVTGQGASGASTWPNNDQGFGRVQLSNVLPIAAAGDRFQTEVVDQSRGLVTGDAQAYTFHVSASSTPLKIVLAWTDYPGTLGAAKALVNDLDLQVTAPDGTVYRGNHFGSFAWGQSLAGGSFDTTNNNEAVIVKAPAAGDWKVQVIAANVPVGPQPFALVATGGLDGGYGRVLLDKASYGETETVNVTVVDGNATSVQVTANSTLEPAGESVTLTQAAAGEPWRGSIALALGQPAPDGVLQVRDGDTITVTYTDASPVHTARVTALVHAGAPAISTVRAESIDTTSAVIRWRTDRPSTSEVSYDIPPSGVPTTVVQRDLVTDHAVTLTGLQANTSYEYVVASADQDGHRTVDSNAGVRYPFQTSPWGDILVVLGDATFPAEREASYADALNLTGWTWSFWRAADLGPPPLSLLQGARAVVWQVGLEQYPTFNASARALLKAYLDGGGRLLVSSHDTSWSLGSSTSPWYTPGTAAWLQGVLKVAFACDPTTTAEIDGVSGDPVSGAYATASGIAYTPHREGGADDQLAFPDGGADAGGTSYLQWTDTNTNTGASPCPNNSPVGLRWVSSSANGTAGTSAWGGTPSRLDYFAFEITGLDTNGTDLRPASPVRAQVLDNALRWLVGTSAGTLDRDHPTVTVTAPAAGSYTSSPVAVNWTAVPNGAGIAIGSTFLDVSADGGQSWTHLTSYAGNASGYAWSVGAFPNGDAYRIRVVVHDDGSPFLVGIGLSPAFAVHLPGGDRTGPRIVPGSVRIAPLAPGAAAPATVNATADDTRTGASAIAAAELFFNATAPSASDYGRGAPMAAADGSFNASVEALTWTGAVFAAPGSSCLWVHARDASGNWGPIASLCFPVLSLGPDVQPPAPAALASLATANGGADLVVTWGRAWDDGFYGGTTRYRVLRATVAAGPYALVGSNVTATGSPTYAFTDPGMGTLNASNVFYRVESFDAADNAMMSPAIAAKYHVTVAAGLNLLGFPVDPGSARLTGIAFGLSWSVAYTYNACGGGFGWGVGYPGDDGALRLGLGRGLWLNASASGVVTLLGITPQATALRLCAGWNLVAIPGFATNVTAGEVRLGSKAVVGFSTSGPYFTQPLASDTTALLPGAGYWVYASTATDVTLPGW